MKTKLLYTFFMLGVLLTQGQVTNGLVASYSFNNGNANDEAGTNNGTVTAAVLTTDRFGNANKAYSFNGSSYINCGNPTVISAMTTAYSISAWFKRSSAASGYEVIAAKWNTTPASEHFFLGSSGNSVAWAAAGPGNQGTNAPYTVPLNTWVHAVFTWESNGTHKIYINGTLSGSLSTASHTVNVMTPVNFMIGAQSPTSRLFNGSIDDVKIYNRVLTSTEVSSLYNETNPVTTTINEVSQKTIGTSAFPNPTEGKLFFSNTIDINLNDISGKTILTQQQTNNVDLSEFEAGIYFAVITDGDKTQTIKVIKQ